MRQLTKGVAYSAALAAGYDRPSSAQDFNARAYAGRRLGNHRLTRHRVRRDRSVTVELRTGA